MNPKQERNDAHEPTARFAVFGSHFVAATVGLALAYAHDTYERMKNVGSLLTLDRPHFLLALAYGFALLWPLALVVAGTLTVAERVAPRAALRIRAFVSPRGLLRRAPTEVADLFLGAVVFAGTFLLLRGLTMTIIARLHALGIMASAIALLAPFVLLFGVIAFRMLSPATRRLFRGMDGAACPLLAVAVIVPFVIAGRARFAEVAPEIERSIQWPIVWTLVIFVLVGAVVDASLPRRGRGGKRQRTFALLLTAGSLVATTSAVLTYGGSSSQRFFVEEVSWSASLAHRGLSELLDRDGDGHPRLLAGRDCNDHDASVHPGAIDVAGDGIDSDCFGGDGTPRFDDRGVGTTVTQPSVPAPNVLLVSIDTMRPDRLALLGNRRHVAPRLDAFAREAVVFRNSEAAAPRTSRSIPAVFTGQHPGMLHYERSLGRIDVTRSNDFLAEIVADRYESAAIVGTTYFVASPNTLQGFGLVENGPSVKPSPSWATDRAVTWLDHGRNAQKPFFLWVHYFTPHEPYLGDRFPSRFGDGPEAAYDTEIWRADEQVGRLLDHLSASGLASNTVVIVFSDHGESLGEHGAWGHSTRLNEEQIRTVLMIRAPGYPPRVVSTPVGLFDLFPTILDFMERGAPEPMSARSLLPLMRGDDRLHRDRPLFAEILPDAIYAIETQSVRRGNDKLIFWPRTGRYQLFDLGRDPAEARDVSDANPRRAKELRDLLLAWDVSAHRSENRVSQIIHDAHVRALPPDVTRYDAHFVNGITLVGAKLYGDRFVRDGLLRADLYFRADRAIPSDYYIHLAFTPEGDGPSFAGFAAHHTAIDGSYPTSLWRPGETFVDTVTMRVPTTIAPEVPLVARVELWSAFHTRTPVPVQTDGLAAEGVVIGHATVH